MSEVVARGFDSHSQGLRCFRLGKSAFLASLQANQVELTLFAQTMEPEFEVPAVAAEALLKAGVMLDAAWSHFKLFEEEAIVSDGVCVVLARALNDEVVQAAMNLESVHTVIFLEDAFAGLDAVKANAHFAFKQANKTMKTI